MQKVEKLAKIGYIFACTKTSEKECIERSLFATNKLYEDKALEVKKGDSLFLYNLDSDTLFGPFTAKSHGKKDIIPNAFDGKYPYQIQVEKKERITSIKHAKQILGKLNISWRDPLDNNQLKFLYQYIDNPSNFDWDKVTEYIGKLAKKKSKTLEKPKLSSTTLWDYPTQSYGETKKGSNKYAGVTPAFVIYNMIKRYTERGDLVLDPMAGSGTTIDVCNEEGRRCVAFDIVPTRREIIQNDARKIPLDDNSVDMIFIDSPYGDNIKYNEHPDNIGNISSENELFYDELEKVMSECFRVLKTGKVLGWLIGDQWVKKKFTPVGFKVYERLTKYFEPVDIICVVRRNQTSNTGMWYNRAIRFNFYLRGFKYLLIMKKSSMVIDKKRSVKWKQYQRKKLE